MTTNISIVRSNMETRVDKYSQDERDKCCAKCKYFEERTGFCRYNPPIPIAVHNVDGSTFISSVYSKINMPGIDWCQKFEKNS